ncbi:MAG: UbiA family prenyltransferase [Candidatus Dormibacteria bacterium]
MTAALSRFGERRQHGRLLGFFYLLHPGPSLLVTAVFLAAVALIERRVPSALRTLQLLGLMLPAQFAIGTLNDVADAPSDRLAKPYKPLVRGVTNRRFATVVGVVLAIIGIGVSITINVTTAAFTVLGFSAGLLYDVGIGRTPLSVVPWWTGFSALAFATFAAAGRLNTAVLWIIPLALFLSLGLHCANVLPDLDGDRKAGSRSLPVLMGRTGSRSTSLFAPVVAVALAVWTAVAASALTWAVVATAALLLALVTAVAASREMRSFPPLAVGSALLAVAWLATVPR